MNEKNSSADNYTIVTDTMNGEWRIKSDLISEALIRKKMKTTLQMNFQVYNEEEKKYYNIDLDEEWPEYKNLKRVYIKVMFLKPVNMLTPKEKKGQDCDTFTIDEATPITIEELSTSNVTTTPTTSSSNRITKFGCKRTLLECLSEQPNGKRLVTNFKLSEEEITSG